MSDDLSKDDAPTKVSFHSLKDEESDKQSLKSGDYKQSLRSDDLKSDEISEPVESAEPVEPEESEESAETTDTPDPEHEQYYLQTVKVGEQPEWPRPKEDLDVFSQPLENGLIQYWAYPKNLSKSADDLPHAEELAQKNQSENASIVIDQICDHLTPGSCLELVLIKNGHALAKTESNLDNLEANISSLLDLGRQNFGVKAEHFMSTSNVAPEVEKRLDDLEEAEEKPAKEYNMGQNNTAMEENQTPLYFNERPAVVSENKRSKWVVLIPILILIIIFGSAVYFRGSLLSKVMNKINPPKQEIAVVTPSPTPTPTPTPSVERSGFTVRVLNGTPTTGAAGVLADKLKALGWKIDKTGNATSSAILESFVRVKPGVSDDAVKILLLDITDYQGSSSSSSLKSTDKADLEFVIGKK